MIKPKRFDVCLINLDPTIGSEIKKTRPCVVISPDEINLSNFKTIIVAPMTSTVRDHIPTRVNTLFNGKQGQIAIDQIRAIDRGRIVKYMGKINNQTSNNILKVLQELFSE